MTNAVTHAEFTLKKPILGVNELALLILLITVIATFVPFSPVFPAADSESSWMFGTNQATAQGLSFGREIIYSFGPYASIYTELYHPATDFMMVSGSLYLALSYFVCLVILINKIHWRWLLAFCATFAVTMHARDALLFSYALLVGLVSLKIILLKDKALATGRYSPYLVALIFFPFGLLPLIKGTILILCVSITVLCFAFFTISKKKLLALICVTCPVVSMALFWVLSGQSADALSGYLVNMVPIASGYTDAMGRDGFIHEVALYIALSFYLLHAVCNEKNTAKTSKAFLLCVFIAFLFVSFKSGFVRHDGHALIASSALLVGSLLLALLTKNEGWNIKQPVLVAWISAIFYLLTVLTYSFPNKVFERQLVEKGFDSASLRALGPYQKVTQVYDAFGLAGIIKTLIDAHTGTGSRPSVWHGIINRVENENWPRIKFDAAVRMLREQAPFEVLQGTTDIYPSNQSSLIASGNSWAPRPIFQSNFVFTPALAELNRKHLLGGDAPDNIIFSVEPIDGRIPSIEDGASWPVLMANYVPTRMKDNFLFLQRGANIGEIEEPIALKGERHTFGENVKLPQSSRPIFATIEIQPTVIGRIVSLLYKPGQLQIILTLNSGIKKQYRIVSGMAKSCFLISPLIESTVEFGKLYDKGGALDDKSVKSISIMPLHGNNNIPGLWHDEYNVTFRQIR